MIETKAKAMAGAKGIRSFLKIHRCTMAKRPDRIKKKPRCSGGKKSPQTPINLTSPHPKKMGRWRSRVMTAGMPDTRRVNNKAERG